MLCWVNYSGNHWIHHHTSSALAHVGYLANLKQQFKVVDNRKEYSSLWGLTLIQHFVVRGVMKRLAFSSCLYQITETWTCDAIKILNLELHSRERGGRWLSLLQAYMLCLITNESVSHSYLIASFQTVYFYICGILGSSPNSVGLKRLSHAKCWLTHSKPSE